MAFLLAFSTLALSLGGAASAADCRPLLRDLRASGDLIQTVQLTVAHEGADCPALLNQAPLLMGAWANPAAARDFDVFQLFVTYVDAEGDLPALIRAILDGRPPIALNPVNPADADSRDGILYRGALHPDPSDRFDRLPHGTLTVRFEASDGHHPPTLLQMEGPRVVERTGASVRAPNPTNRLLIHPIANGPTLVPPVEVLPPLGQVPGAEANGLTSYSFLLDPTLAQGDTSFIIGEGFGLELRDGGFERGGYLLQGDGGLVDDAHSGAHAVRLLASTGPPSEGAAQLPVRSDYALAQLFGLTARARSAARPAAELELQLLLSLDRDSSADACLAASVPVPGEDWTPISITQGSPMELRLPGCTDGARRTGTLEELVDDPVLGLSDILAARVQARTGAPALLDGGIDVDSFVAQPLLPAVDGDFDVCFYASGPGIGPESFSPISCVSDIGPNTGKIPRGAVAANVWADTIVPNPFFQAPRHPYPEPTSFELYVSRPGTAPSFQMPSFAGAQGVLRAVHDLDGDGAAGPQEPVVFQSEVPMVGADPIQFPWDLSGVPDGEHRLLLHYEDATGASSTVLAVERFVNDLPMASLSADRGDGLKRIQFRLAAADADDAQGSFSATRGGLAAWRLDFGDGQHAEGSAPVPSCLSHKYAQRGSYTVTFTVGDRAGATATSVLQIEVPDADRTGC